MKNILITGGAGFIGSNFIMHILAAHPDYSIFNIDALTYAGNPENLKSIEDNKNYTFIKGDIRDADVVKTCVADNDIDTIINFAAESHVDRSITGPDIFIDTNVKGTLNLLNAARNRDGLRFYQISTDEVYGSLGAEGYFTETTPIAPNSPYSASKASADLLVRAYHHTFGLDAVISRCSNNYGPYQFPEKLLPLMIHNAVHDKPLPVYGDGKNVRDWIHVADHCRAIDIILHQAAAGSVYNIGGNNEWKNIDIVKLICSLLDKPESLITFVKDRPGHDQRYAIDASKLKNDLGWEPAYTFETGIRETIDWYRTHDEWVTHITSGEYQKYYEAMYGNR